MASNLVGGVELATLDVRSLVPKWRAALNETEYYAYAIPL